MESSRVAQPPVLLPLEIKGIVANSGFRWLLIGVEGWRGLDLVFTLSADGLCHLLEHELATAAVHALIQEELGRRRPLARVERPLPDAEARARLRAARRARRKEMP